MKIVHVNFSDNGGAAVVAMRLHNQLLSEGIDSVFLSLVKNHDNIKHHHQLTSLTCAKYYFPALLKHFWKRLQIKIFGERNLEKEYLEGRAQGFDVFTFPFAEFDSSNSPFIKHADIIHLHWVSRGTIDYTKFFKKTSKKIVWTLHDMNPFTGGCHHSDGWKGFENDCSRCPQLRGTANQHISKEVLQLKKAALESFPIANLTIVTPSNWLSKLAGKSVVLKQFNRLIIPNLSDSGVFRNMDKLEARKKLNLPENKKIILFIANDLRNPRKGYVFLKSALKEITNKNELLLCTVGGTIEESEIQILTLGYVNNEKQMAMIYAAADVFVLPSIAENFPNVVVESLMCGTPVVTFNVGGITEQLTKENGILVELGKIVDLQKAIQFVLNNPDSYNPVTISNNARNLYDSKIVTNQYKKIYADLLK